ncbi:hypothetical protein ACFLS8_00545 [Chloroflexota bacterium]
MFSRVIKLFKVFNKDESGVGLILVLVAMILGSLIVVPLVEYMGTGVRVGIYSEENSEEVYAAGAGVTWGMWHVKNGTSYVPELGDSASYDLDEDINGKEVTVLIESFVNEEIEDAAYYKITSTATGDHGSKTIESYIDRPLYTFLLTNAITSIGDVTIRPGGIVDGDVYYGDDLWVQDEEEDITGDVGYWDPMNWPPTSYMQGYYFDDVDEVDPFTEDEINAATSDPLGPIYRDGDLTIDNTSGAEPTLGITGTIYITGDLIFKQAGSKEYTIDLGGNTIFVEGSVYMAGHRVTLTNEGAIIAIGDIDFQPKGQSEEDEYILVMSLEGQVNVSPQGDFYGSFAGNLNVDLSPITALHWVEPDEYFRFPGNQDITEIPLRVNTWQIA